MISRYNVYLNDVSLSSVDDNIYIYDISYSPAPPERSTQRLVGRQGGYSGSEYIEDNRITVSFTVRHYDTQNRQSAVQAIISWAINGGWLKTSDRVGQKIYVKASKLPSVSSVLRWTDTLTVEFTAYDYPFWVEEIPINVALDSGDSDSVFVPGVYKTDVEALIIPSETITSLTVTCGNTSISLTGISVAANTEIRISYTDEHHIQQIMAGSTSLLDKRTAASNDDLILQPGTSTVSFTASGSATCTLIIKGVWL